MLTRLIKINWIHHLEMLLVLSFMDLKVKYRSSVLGFFWSFLKPILQFVVFYTIFKKILHVSNGDDYALQLFFGVLIWTWFSEATNLGLNSYLGKKSIISKIKTNKLYPPLAAFLTPTMNYFFNILIFLLAYVLFIPHLPEHIISINNLMIFLSSYLCLSLLIISCNLILANLNVLYRDIQPLWEITLTYGVFLTPVIYHIPVHKNYEIFYYSLNLLAFPLLNLKYIFFENQVNLYTNIPVVIGYYTSLTILVVIAYFTYKKMSHKMVDFL